MVIIYFNFPPLKQLSDAGFHCFAPDWIGFGFSDKPQPGYGFNYTGFIIKTSYILKIFSCRNPIQSYSYAFLSFLIEKEFHDALDKLLEVLGVKSPFFLVVQVPKNE